MARIGWISRDRKQTCDKAVAKEGDAPVNRWSERNEPAGQKDGAVR